MRCDVYFGCYNNIVYWIALNWTEKKEEGYVLFMGPFRDDTLLP